MVGIYWVPPVGQTLSLSFYKYSSFNLHPHLTSTIHGLHCKDEKPRHRKAACLLSRLPIQGQAAGTWTQGLIWSPRSLPYAATSEEEVFTQFGSCPSTILPKWRMSDSLWMSSSSSSGLLLTEEPNEEFSRYQPPVFGVILLPVCP